MKRRLVLQAASAAAVALPLAWPARRRYPSRSIRYIVPVAAGGGNDMIARVVTERWGKLLGQTFVVENQSGGGGVVACQAHRARRARRLHADAGLRRHARHEPGDAQGAPTTRSRTSRRSA